MTKFWNLPLKGPHIYTSLETMGKVPIYGKYVLFFTQWNWEKLYQMRNLFLESNLLKYLNNAILGKCNFSTQTWKGYYETNIQKSYCLAPDFSKIKQLFEPHTVLKSWFFK